MFFQREIVCIKWEQNHRWPDGFYIYIKLASNANLRIAGKYVKHWKMKN